MKTTFANLQKTPRRRRPQDARAQQALQASGAHLERTAQHLASRAPDYQQALADSLTSLRQAYTALLAYHSFPPGVGATIAEMSAPAEALASMMRLYTNRALPLEAMAGAVRPGATVPVAVREAVEMSFFLARDTLSVVLGSLPEHLTDGVIRLLNRAQAIRTGRLRLPPETLHAQRAAPATNPIRAHMMAATA